MTNKKNQSNTDRELRMDEEMSFPEFGDLVHELTGTTLEPVFKSYFNNGEENNAKGDVE